VPGQQADGERSQAKGAELDARLKELKGDIARQNQLSKASEQEEVLLRHALLPFQVRTCMLNGCRQTCAPT
jgi:hypothetical protein